MKKIFLLLFVLLFIFSCSSENKNFTKNVNSGTKQINEVDISLEKNELISIFVYSDGRKKSFTTLKEFEEFLPDYKVLLREDYAKQFIEVYISINENNFEDEKEKLKKFSKILEKYPETLNSFRKIELFKSKIDFKSTDIYKNFEKFLRKDIPFGKDFRESLSDNYFPIMVQYNQMDLDTEKYKTLFSNLKEFYDYLEVYKKNLSENNKIFFKDILVDDYRKTTNYQEKDVLDFIKILENYPNILNSLEHISITPNSYGNQDLTQNLEKFIKK